MGVWGLAPMDFDSQDDQLHRVAKRHIHQSAHRVPHSLGHALGGMTEQAGQRHNGDGVHGKDEAGAQAGGLGSDADGDEDEQEVNVAREDDGAGRVVEALGHMLFGFRKVAVLPYEIPRPFSLRRCSWCWMGGGCVLCAVVCRRLDAGQVCGGVGGDVVYMVYMAGGRGVLGERMRAQGRRGRARGGRECRVAIRLGFPEA